MKSLDTFEKELVASMPVLRKQAMAMCRNRDTAEDMVQNALCRALKVRDLFEEGSNLGGWVCTIMKNEYRSYLRNNRRLVEDPDDVLAKNMSYNPDPVEHIAACELLQAIQSMPIALSGPLYMMAVDGASYQEIADECMMQVGTVKSRISRGRAFLGATP